jgi:hypothetical protein
LARSLPFLIANEEALGQPKVAWRSSFFLSELPAPLVAIRILKAG